MAKSSQDKTKSRVNIVYEVPVGDAIEKVSLPFVMGVMADLAGSSKKEAKPIEQRAFDEFTHENFDARMAAIQPRVAMQVPNRLADGGGENLSVEVNFKSMDDFQPQRVAEAVPVLKELLDARRRLDNLLSHLDGNPRAEEMLAELLNDRARLQALASFRSETEVNNG